ncbi:hypothetical protein CHLRE_07g349900v5 [Chlamydomonas reinhardtii]|uniref:Wax synthase domain-containing protein n=1 Tax=Chlamydomonas reinhardtii TaxID=3055 RepID=A0A2K3DL95_CHLRE|nr:uncharacterized protein CHLRE_07g349900v5 [Chlamydomonas reinhardtii]PNW81291.1 hypothetical protein CHLRE_07g349900v5 [Chlamydomonas reinhardtii]
MAGAADVATSAESLFGLAVSPGARLTAMLTMGVAYAVISVRPKPPGLVRLLMSMPLFLLFSVAGLQVMESVTVSGSIGFMFAWLANFKLLAYSANRGPLAHPGLSSGQWLLLLLLPFFPAKRGHRRAQAGGVLLALVCNIALGLALTAFLTSPAGSASSLLRHTGYALYVYVAASLLLDCFMPLGCAALGHMRLQPSMDNPFVSTSVREFWGRRYNQIVSAILQDTVYLPIVEGRWVAEPQEAQDVQGERRPGDDDSKGSGGGVETPAGEGAGPTGLRRRTAAVPGSATAATAVTAAAGEMRHVDSTASTGGAAAAAASGAATALVKATATARTGLDGVDSCASLAASEGQGKQRRQGPEGKPGRRRVPCSRARQLVAMTASFVVSGVMHEVCIAFMCGGRLEGSYHMLAFFLLQPLIIVVQDAATAALLPPHLLTPQEEAAALANGSSRPGGGSSSNGNSSSSSSVGKWTLARRVVTVLRVVVTAVLVVASADVLFWGPFETCRIDERGLKEVLAGVENVKAWAAAARGWFAGAAL